MSKNLRIAISTLLVFIILIGTVLVYIPGLKASSAKVATQTPVCQNSISLKLAPYQAEKYNCDIQRDFWVDLSLSTASGAVAMLTISLTQSAEGAPVVLYNQTASKFSAQFPLTSTGSLLITISNLQNTFNTISGRVTVYNSSLSTITFFQTGYPHRTFGLAVIAVCGILLFVLVWNPLRIATRALDRFARFLQEDVPVSDSGSAS